MSIDIDVSLVEMFRELPVRSGLYTVGPLLLGVAEFVNGYVHQLQLVYPTLFAIVMVAFSVLVTQYHLVEFRIERLDGDHRTFE